MRRSVDDRKHEVEGVTMTEVIHVQKATAAIEQQLVQEAREVMEPCNWRLGRCAAEWVSKTGKTDSDFGFEIGFSKKQVQQRRAVWEKFSSKELELFVTNLTWSHFRAALSWDMPEAVECFQWAVEAEATVQEMIAWRYAQRGEVVPFNPKPLAELVEDTETPDEGMATVTGEKSGEYTPFQNSADMKPGANAGQDPAENAQKPTGNKGGGKPREKAKQPRKIDPAKFNEMEEVDHVMSTVRDLAAPFCAVKKTEAIVRALRALMSELSAIAEKEQES